MLIPTDFYTLIDGSLPTKNGHPIRPWAVLSPLTYRLSLAIFYDSGVWRDFSIYFNIERGYSFHSTLYLNNAKPTESVPELITREEWDDRLFSISSGGKNYGEIIPLNHPPMIDWLLKNDLIRSLGADGNRGVAFLQKLKSVWEIYSEKTPVSEHQAATEMALLGQNVHQYFTLIKLVEPIHIPRFNVAKKSDYSDHFPNFDYSWKRWGRDYIVHKAEFSDLDGKECSAYVGYCFADENNPIWHLIYVSLNNYDKIMVIDSHKDLLGRLSEVGIISPGQFSRSYLPDIPDSFSGAIRTSIDPRFFQSKRIFTNLQFKRY